MSDEDLFLDPQSVYNAKPSTKDQPDEATVWRAAAAIWETKEDCRAPLLTKSGVRISWEETDIGTKNTYFAMARTAMEALPARESRDDEIISDFLMLWREYGQCPDEQLTQDAVALKRKVLGAVSAITEEQGRRG